MHPFEAVLSVSTEMLFLELRGHENVPWADFLLNLRRLRGSDFLMRWSQGVWSEHRLVDAVERTGDFFALAYGPSGVAPDSDVRAFELYFERLEAAGLGGIKRPDLLIFRIADRQAVTDIVASLGGATELPFTSEEDVRMRRLLSMAVIAVECENSLWRAKQMPCYDTPLKPQKRLGGKPGLSKTAVLPTVIIKDEDRQPLLEWQRLRQVPIHVWHVFFDLAFGLALDEAERLIREGLIEATVQVFQAPGGATTKKSIFKFYHHYAYPLGESQEEPQLVASSITDKNGHILPYVRFEGGRFGMSDTAVQTLRHAAAPRR